MSFPGDFVVAVVVATTLVANKSVLFYGFIIGFSVFGVKCESYRFSAEKNLSDYVKYHLFIVLLKYSGKYQRQYVNWS